MLVVIIASFLHCIVGMKNLTQKVRFVLQAPSLKWIRSMYLLNTYVGPLIYSSSNYS